MSRLLFCFPALLWAGFAGAQTGSPLDRESLAKLRREAFENSQAAPVFEMLTSTIGPRLTASPAHRRAAEFARERLASYGLANARLDPLSFGSGWSL